MIDFRNRHLEKDDLSVLRVFCDSCEHSHAVLPDCIIPYSSHMLIPSQQVQKTHTTTRQSLHRISPSSDHTTVGWAPGSISFIM
ncbi:DUF6431 domain-containing protein [Muricoprocola aceti]|uniref:DUF6431 domain-containing protein n=1 Tax=Muricoprocola aceti TaxID=2981772 RepID=UPI003A896914